MLVVNLRTPKDYNLIYNALSYSTISLDISRILFNLYNTFCIDKDGFIRSGELDLSFYEDIFDTVYQNIAEDADILNNNYELLATVKFTLITDFENAILDFLRLIKKASLLNKDISLIDINERVISLEVT